MAELVKTLHLKVVVVVVELLMQVMMDYLEELEVVVLVHHLLLIQVQALDLQDLPQEHITQAEGEEQWAAQL